MVPSLLSVIPLLFSTSASSIPQTTKVSSAISVPGASKDASDVPGAALGPDITIIKPPTKLVNDFDPLLTYFSNLAEFAPLNICASCGYVALIECLSYYDTVLNDDIIPENFDRNQGNTTQLIDTVSVSPGVKLADYPYCNPDIKIMKQSSNNSSSIPDESDDYYNWVNDSDIGSSDFQVSLMKEGNQMLSTSKDDYTCRLSLNDYDSLLSRIHGISTYNIPKISFSFMQEENFDTIQTEEKQDFFKSYIKTNIDNDKPVIVNLCTFNSSNERDK